MFPVFKKLVLAFETEINSAKVCSPLKGSLKEGNRDTCRSHTSEVVWERFLVHSEVHSAVGCTPWANSPSHCPGRHLKTLVGFSSLCWLRKRHLPPSAEGLHQKPPKGAAVSQGSASGAPWALLCPALLTWPCSICPAPPAAPARETFSRQEQPHSLHC